MNNRGFTLIELLVASAGLLVTMAFVAALAMPLRAGFERSLGAADLTGGSRTVLDRLAAEVHEAGSGASVGAGRLADVLPPVVPSASLDSTVWADPGQALRIVRVPFLAPQGRLAAGAAAGSTTVSLDTTNRCTAVVAGCGLRAGTLALLYDSTHGEVVNVSAATAADVRFSAPLTSAFAVGSVLAAAAITTYGLRPAPDGSFRLVRATGMTEQPMLDDVVDFRVRVVGADPRHPRQVELSLRVEAPSAALRGPPGRFFRRPGTALYPADWVPDVETRTTVSLRGAG
jgi:prepilin-type N-terminal cleavage/methylation domain-containing protein